MIYKGKEGVRGSLVVEVNEFRASLKMLVRISHELGETTAGDSAETEAAKFIATRR